MAAAVLPFRRPSPTNATELPERVLRAAQEAVGNVVEALMANQEGMDFEALSDLLLSKGREVTGAMLSTLLNAKAEEETDRAPCPRCGRVCPRHSKSTRPLEGRHGTLRVQRGYFYCAQCEEGFSPFDDRLKLAPQVKQYDLQKAAARLLARLPFDEAAQVFHEITGLSISDHVMHDLGARLGDVAQPFDVLPTRQKVEATIDEHSRGRVWRPVLVVAADGAHTPTRPEAGRRKGKRGSGSWQEAKGFRLYLVGQERIEHLMSWHQIANEQDFGQALRFAATLVPHDKVRIALIGDGAAWIWPHMRAAFPTGKEILDYFHCSEHIHDIAELQYGDDENRQALWIESTMARLHFGDVESVIWGLQRMKPSTDTAEKELASLIGYLQNNAHRINYRANKRGQFPSGSGGIESANKFICHKRMKVSGAWWYKINGNRMLRLRCSIYNGTFDEVFAKYKRSQRRGAVKPPKTSRNA